MHILAITGLLRGFSSLVLGCVTKKPKRKWAALSLLCVLGILAFSSWLSAANIKWIHLEWNANTEPDFAYYDVYRSAKKSGPFLKLNTFPVIAPMYYDANLQAGKTYYYKVRAIDLAKQESGFSNVASATVPGANSAASKMKKARAGVKHWQLY